MITQEEINRRFSYNEITGELTRNIHISSKFPAGSIAGSKYSCGYIYISVNKKRYLAHRLIWLYVHGYFPNGDIDHINGIRSDNRIANLRECSRAENMQNYKKPMTNKSGFIGVHYHSREKKFRAVINFNGRMIRLGCFATAEQASASYLEAKKRLHTFNPSSIR